MMSESEEVFEEAWVSSNYTTVFCTEEEKEHYLHSLSSRGSIPYAMSVVFIKRKLNSHYAKREILGATPDKLRAMIE